MTRWSSLCSGLVLSSFTAVQVARAQAPAPAPGSTAAPTVPPTAYPSPYPYPYSGPPGSVPGYPPPGYAPDGSDRWRLMPLPTEMRYVEGRPIPPGYHLEARARKGLVVSGPIIFGVPYFLSLSSAASSTYDPDRWLYVPGVGPFIDLANRSKCRWSSSGPASTYSDCNDDSAARFFLMFDGLLQVSGMTMLLLGLALPQQVLVRDDAPFVGAKKRTFAWSVAPRTFARDGYGVGMSAIF